jgi:two-component system, NarL family, response regulator DesR
MIRVLLAEDMRILRDTLVSVLNLEDDIKVVAQVAVGTDIVPAALAERPDLAVLDIDLPGTDGLTAAAELHERLPTKDADEIPGKTNERKLKYPVLQATR